MKIVFFMRSTVYVRNFESTLRLLAERGHQVDVVAETHPLADTILARIGADCPGVQHVEPPVTPFRAWSYLGLELRRAVDYLRYREAEYSNARRLRQRAERGAPPFAVAAAKHPLLASRFGRRAFASLLRVCDRAVPRDPAIDEFVRSRNPDLVLVTPLVEPGSPQSEYLRSARGLGIRTGLCVYSWDNLTNKGLVHEPLDLVTVWNETMKREAVTLHRLPPEKVVVTGAAAYDHWFAWQPRESREAFCARVGLRADRPYLLYLCSSKFIAPNEVGFVRTLVAGLRSGSPRLRDVGMLVRPHPQNTAQWQAADLSDLENVVVWPRANGNPVDADTRAEYFDSIFHSAAVVGVNTSAQIESAIVGRGVYTLLASEFRDTQDGTLHFHHLKTVNGGLLHTARTHDELAAQLELAITASGDDGRGRRFVEAFVRPHGLDQPATPRLVAAIEATAALGPARPEGDRWYSPLLRPALARAAARLAAEPRARKEKGLKQAQQRARRDAERAAQHAARIAAKERAEAERQRSKDEAAARRRAECDARERVRINAFDRYLSVRDALRALRANGSNGVALTTTERQIATSLAHLWDATPETIATLRRCGAAITGIDAADYERLPPELEAQLITDRRVLRQQTDTLYQHEPEILGGFGLRRKDDLFNADSLRISKALTALNDAAVLPPAGGSERTIVWEIGGGWGGFAAAFKRVRPNTTYLITGMPEPFLISAVYLSTLLPDARIRIARPSEPQAELWRDWEQVDFVFAPESAVPDLRPPRLDLVVDIMTLRLMSAERIEMHVRQAYELGARYFYSLLPSERVDGEAPVVWAPIEQRYWPHPIPARGDRLTRPVDLDGNPAVPSDCAHLVGWRRLRS